MEYLARILTVLSRKPSRALGKGAFSNAAGPLEHDGSGSIARFPIEEFIVGRTSEY